MPHGARKAFESGAYKNPLELSKFHDNTQRISLS